MNMGISFWPREEEHDVQLLGQAFSALGIVPTTENTEWQWPLCTFRHEGKSAQAGEGVHGHPLSLYSIYHHVSCSTSTLQLRGQIHSPCFSLPLYVLFGSNPHSPASLYRQCLYSTFQTLRRKELNITTVSAMGG
jgi:hypothetical protein